MPSSLFSRPQVEPLSNSHYRNQSDTCDYAGAGTQRQSKLKSITSLFHHPFSNTAVHSSNNPHSSSSPSHVIAYRQPIDSPSTTSARSYNLTEAFNRPGRGGSTTSLPLRSNTTTSIRSIGTGTGVGTPSSIIAGLPLTGTNIAIGGVTHTSHTLQAQIRQDHLSGGIPTLASAIHIPDAVPIAPSVSPQTVSRATFHSHAREHANASMISLFEAQYAPANNSTTSTKKNPIGRSARDRSNSRTSVETTKHTKSNPTSKRRMSRRLSLDNILPKLYLGGSLRKKDKSTTAGGDGATDRRWSVISTSELKGVVVQSGATVAAAAGHTTNQTQSKAAVAAPANNPVVMAMPGMRTWRNKFTVNRDKDRTNAAGPIKTEGTARVTQTRENVRTEVGHNGADVIEGSGKRYEERTIRRVGGRGSMSSSRNRPFAHRPSSITSSLSYPDPAATPRSAPSPSLQMHLTSASVTTLDSPSPLPRPLHTPLGRGRKLRAAQDSLPQQQQQQRGEPTAAPSFLFSPAQDDKSIVDPERSPLPLSLSPGVPVPSLPEQYLTQVQHLEQLHSQAESGRYTIGISQAYGQERMGMSRHQSLSELKEAYHRMRDLSGVECISGDTSRSVSGTTGEQVNVGMDLGKLDKTLQAVLETRPTLQSSVSSTSDRGDAPGQPISLGISHSSQSWHTAHSCSSITTTPLPPLPMPLSTSSSNRSIDLIGGGGSGTLPRSRSKSHTDLSTYSSSKNLLEHVEKTQGPGWWSGDKSFLEDEQGERQLSTRRRSEFEVRLEKLERLAQSSTLPHRARFEDADEDEIVEDSTTTTTMVKDVAAERSPNPTPIRRSFASTERFGSDEIKSMRPRSSFDLRSSTISNSNSKFTKSPSVDRPNRPSSGFPHSKTFPSTLPAFASPGHNGQGARLSLVAGSTWGKSEFGYSPRRTVLEKRSSLAPVDTGTFTSNNSTTTDDATPIRPRNLVASSVSGGGGGGSMVGPFVSSRISPDIARRASWMVNPPRSGSGAPSSLSNTTPTPTRRFNSSSTTDLVDPESKNTSPTRSDSRQTSSTAPTSLPSDSDHDDSTLSSNGVLQRERERELEQKLIMMKSRHALELDAVLTALSLAKGEVKGLKEEIGSLHRLLGEGVEEREKLREKVRCLEESLDTQSELPSRNEKENSLGIRGEEVYCLDVKIGGGGMVRSESVASSLLPELSIAAESPLRDAQLPTTTETTSDEIDEFGRRTTSFATCRPNEGGTIKDGRRRPMGSMMPTKARVVSNTSDTTCESNVLYEETAHTEEETEGWTLKLREDDEAYLDDL
ncbi:hypothetical protein CI109_104894 [Kwoniella shandongensis]|uniref:Uncharacterized protein n=1 Tax=Kwoniella shandongensis TaxID=1734106 RepID=A0A5M6BSR6_9TREE|nr:uncharacterized protein CI109_006613 [Kwoniella shandongensis]KAA5525062.1 hypothetical protein CI109_006613 [Kwoniella shandongensis]